MSARDKSKLPEDRDASGGELRLKARAVSRGVAIGKVVWLHGNSRQFYKINIRPDDTAREIKRLNKALDIARRQLVRLAADGKLAKSSPEIFETHLALIDDPTFVEKFRTEIESQLVNAEWAIKHVSDLYISQYKALEDETLRNRYIDLEDVSERVLGALGGQSSAELPYAKDSIIAAKELRPSTLIELADQSPRGIITEHGGWTSHTFIIAREMKLPAVTGLKKISRRIKTGDRVIVDGFNGHVIVHPEASTIKHYTPDKARISRNGNDPETVVTKSKTVDGVKVRIYANSDTPEVFAKAASFGVEGVGLYRSEFLFELKRGAPSESKQAAAYQAMAAAAVEGRVKIRTFDLGAERLIEQGLIREKNPALGLRAIRLGLTYKKLLQTQLRALLRASHESGDRIDIVLPMVTGVSEIIQVKQLLAEEAEKLASKSVKLGEPKLGVMIEVPSAVLMIDEIIELCDFICLGTNDLIQYLLAADRDNESVAGWYRTLHPAVLKAIGKVLAAARSANKPAIVCGEMAGSPYYVPILIGLGATDLSMNVNSIVPARRMITGIAAEECRALVKSFDRAASVEEVEELADKHIKANWKHLFPEDFSFS